MKRQGLVRKVDDNGRITLPIEFRRQHDMMIGDLVEISGTENGILIEPYSMSCVFCKETKNVQEHKGQPICEECIKFFKRLGNGSI